jgi:ketosteroid isomerase-like protein
VTRESAEVVRTAWAALSRRDAAGFLACLDHDVEAVPFGAAMEGRAYRGHEGVREWIEREIWATYETFEVHPDEIRDVGGRLLAYGHWIARGKESGVELDIRASWVVDVRDGKIVRWQTYTDREEALKDVGLKE